MSKFEAWPITICILTVMLAIGLAACATTNPLAIQKAGVLAQT